MKENGKAAAQINEQTASNNCSTTNITKNQKKSNSGKKSERKHFTINSQPIKVNIKIYEEQMIGGEEKFKERILFIDCKNFCIVAIKHDRDTVRGDDDLFELAIEKPHWHIVAWCAEGQKRIRIYEWLEMLGIAFRSGLDDSLFYNRGVEYCESIPASLLYNLHLTEQAQRDGKEVYDIEEFVSNLTVDEIKQAMQGYKRFEPEEKRPSIKVLEELANTAESIGYELQSFEEWWDGLSFVLQSHSKMKTIKERYLRGVEKRVMENNKVNRLCIFIKGAPNLGKTYACMEALKGKKVLEISGGGTGKYDNLQPTTNAIVISDDKAPNLLNMTDNYFCRAYRRQSGNPFWCGDYFIVTSNKTFEEWAEECGISPDKYNPTTGQWEEVETFKALRSRFYICEVLPHKDGFNTLYCHEPSKRGSFEDQKERYEKFVKFRDAYNVSLQNYKPEEMVFDYSDLNGGYYLGKSAEQKPVPEEEPTEQDEPKQKDFEIRFV